MKKRKGIIGILIFLLTFVLFGCSSIFLEFPFEQKVPSPQNETMLQAFYWEIATGDYLVDHPEEKDLWVLLEERASDLSKKGFTAVWLPPANKGMNGTYDVGYATYDLWDLGEFDQKGTIRTKYGTKEELENAISSLHSNNIKVYYDAVLNHRMGADGTEMVKLDDSSPDKPGETIQAWTIFNFPGRGGKYSDFTWNWQCFDGVDRDQKTQTSGKYLFEDKNWDYTFYWDDDYLMGADVNYENSSVREDVTNWGKWIVNDINFDGFRLDAVKHVDYGFVNEWINDVQDSSTKDLFLDTVGNESLKVFDFPLRTFFEDMIDGADLRNLHYVGLVNKDGYEDRAVTFVDNHDTNRDNVDPGIYRRKYQAYAYILTREYGTPVVFWKDYYIYGMKEGIDKLLEVRRDYAYGRGYEIDNNDEDVYGYVREGLPEVEKDGLVLLISDGESNEVRTKRINSRQPNTTFYDYTGHIQGTVTTDENGYGDFKVIMSENEGWSVWVPL